jgi:hypothetical protein
VTGFAKLRAFEEDVPYGELASDIVSRQSGNWKEVVIVLVVVQKTPVDYQCYWQYAGRET